MIKIIDQQHFSVFADETAKEEKEARPENPSHDGHRIEFRPNTESRRVGLNRLKELMEKNLGLKAKKVGESDDLTRDKRFFYHHQPYYVDYCYDYYGYYG